MEQCNMNNVRSLIVCGRCDKNFNDPRLLPCSHTYCYNCIRHMTSNDFNYVECPQCDGAKIFINQIDELTVNQTAIDMIESIKFERGMISCSNCNSQPSDYWCDDCTRVYCKSCIREVHDITALNNHQLMSLRDKPTELKPCKRHADEKLKYWCRKCDVCVCSDCLLNEHQQHSYVTIVQVANALQKQINTELSNIKKNLDNNARQTDMDIADMAEEHKNILETINQLTANLREILDRHQRELTQKINDADRYNSELMENFRVRLQNELKYLRSQQLKLEILFSNKDPLKLIGAKQQFYDYTTQLNRTLENLRLPAKRIYRIEGTDRIPDAREKILECGMLIEGFVRTNENIAYNNSELAQKIADSQDKNEWQFKEHNLIDKDIKMIADSLRQNTIVVKLDISQRHIDDPGVQYLADALRQNRTLKSLYLYKNQINDHGIQFLSQALKENTTLTLLDLSQNIITDQGIEHLADMLQHNQTITTLHLSQNQISDQGVAYIANALQRNNTLEILHLSRNQIGNKGAKCLADVLRQNTALIILNLYWNYIGDLGAQSFSEALKINRTLEVLYLSRNRIGNEGAKQLINILQINETCHEISLHDNRIDYKTQSQVKNILKRHNIEVVVNL